MLTSWLMSATTLGFIGMMDDGIEELLYDAGYRRPARARVAQLGSGCDQA
jgi:hypothetical protein